jgi:hypothetical protein
MQGTNSNRVGRVALACALTLVAAASLSACATDLVSSGDRVDRCAVIQRQHYGSKYTDTQYANACHTFELNHRLNDDGTLQNDPYNKTAG